MYFGGTGRQNTSMRKLLIPARKIFRVFSTGRTLHGTNATRFVWHTLFQGCSRLDASIRVLRGRRAGAPLVWARRRFKRRLPLCRCALRTTTTFHVLGGRAYFVVHGRVIGRKGIFADVQLNVYLVVQEHRNFTFHALFCGDNILNLTVKL